MSDLATVLSLEEGYIQLQTAQGRVEHILPPIDDLKSIDLNVGDHVLFTAAHGKIQKIQILQRRQRQQNPFLVDLEAVKNWSDYLGAIRQYFAGQGFCEVSSPSFVVSSGTETHVDPIRIKLSEGEFFLPTSPEFSHKKLLSQGLSKIYEVRSCFRNDAKSKTHWNEFTMLEWYRAYERPTKLIEDVQNLFELVATQLRPPHLPEITEHVSMSELFQRIELDLTPQTDAKALRQMAAKHRIYVQDSDDWADLFWRIFLEKIEPQMTDQLLFVYNFPPQLAAYAQINDQGWAERFEVYYRGLELANAYYEVIDPMEQERRFWDEQRGKLNPVPIDSQLIECMKWGLPPSSGIALGLERMFMALFGIDDIARMPRQVMR